MMDDTHAMVATRTSGIRKVRFNTGNVAVFLTERPTTPDLPWHVKELVSLPAELRKSLDNRGVDKHATVVAAQIASTRRVCAAHKLGEVLLSPFAFTTANSGRVAMLVADHCLDHLS